MITGHQLRAARSLIGLEQLELAELAKVAIGTIRRMEGFGDAPVGCNAQTLSKITATLEKSGVVFIDHGVQMRAATATEDPGTDGDTAIVTYTPPSEKPIHVKVRNYKPAKRKEGK